MNIMAIRIKWKKILFLIFLVMFIVIDCWEIYSIIVSKEIDSFLLIIAFTLTIITILLFIETILNFIKKKDAIIIEDNKVITYEFKKKIINLNEIKDIRYSLSNGGRLFGSLSSGNIIFILKDNKKIIISDLKDVKNVNANLRNLILKK